MKNIQLGKLLSELRDLLHLLSFLFDLFNYEPGERRERGGAWAVGVGGQAKWPGQGAGGRAGWRGRTGRRSGERGTDGASASP